MGLALAAWLAWPVVAGMLARVEPMREAEAVEEKIIEALVIRDETVVAAPAEGTLRCSVPEGERVRKGTPFAYLETPGQKYALRAPVAGVLSYRLDGMETLLDPEDPWAARELPPARAIDRHDGDVLSGGQPVARVVDNLDPLILRVRVEPGSLPPSLVKAGASWTMREEGGTPFGAEVAGVLPDGTGTVVALRVDSYPQRLLGVRRLSCRVMTRRAAGLAVPENALVFREGRPGLYLAPKGVAHWVPVRVEHRLGGQAFISGPGLEVGTRYIANPRWVREGVRAR
ncbi:MAG: HlyD family efflux transporter periplasmic adaptor subunit [Thermoanaerobacterales bacterium]|nr:HlyD family efflux transporter periplasmic adaptor subunit [Thermoanaerobacterales bacterium]